ncbi:MAG: glucosyltransferase [bacterium]|nr:glucosyltransferase [bacterium]MCM1374443.1 hypothetical protein [Muribaculum sp.]
MKIAWFCIPAHGHTNPTLGLVRAMADRGHEIYYFSFEMFREKLERAGARFIGCDGCEPEMEGEGDADRIGKDMVYSTELLVSSTLALDGMVAEKVREIKPDLIVSDSVAYWGKLTALKYHIPYVSSTTTFAFNNASARYFQTSFKDMLKMIMSMPKINRQLQRLRDKGYPVKNILEIVQNDNNTDTIVYTSAYFQPCAETFSDRYCFIGPSVRPIEHTIEKTADTTVYISMGTVVKNEALYRACVEALRDTGYQVIISLGSSDVHFADLPDQIRTYESVDQMAALSIADVFITHCGMNSVSEGLHYKVPLILCPQTPEQRTVARRTEELGAGILLRSTEKADILNAVEQALKNPAYREAAGKISASFRQSGGVEKAVAFLEKKGENSDAE